jgi:hypothetical protein
MASEPITTTRKSTWDKPDGEVDDGRMKDAIEAAAIEAAAVVFKAGITWRAAVRQAVKMALKYQP